MRIRAILLISAGVLFFSLATIELSELLRLVDDTSNDFALTNFEEASDAAIQNQGSRVAYDPIVPTANMSHHGRSPVRFVSDIPSISGHDLLHSFCIQRT